MTNEQITRQAIDQSMRETHSVALELTGDEMALHEAVSATWTGEWDYTTENDGSLDVWGWDDQTPENEQDWRLKVTLVDA